jgi:hypothetical protein
MSDSLLIVGVFICIGVFLIIAYGLYHDTKTAAYTLLSGHTGQNPLLGGRRRYRYRRKKNNSI